MALIQDRPVLGGNNSSEVRVWLQGARNDEPWPNVGNIVAQCLYAASLLACLHAFGADQNGFTLFTGRHQVTRQLAVLVRVAAVTGPRNATTGYALAAQRHMSHYGTTTEQLGAIAVSQRGAGLDHMGQHLLAHPYRYWLYAVEMEWIWIRR